MKIQFILKKGAPEFLTIYLANLTQLTTSGDTFDGPALHFLRYILQASILSTSPVSSALLYLTE